MSKRLASSHRSAKRTHLFTLQPETQAWHFCVFFFHWWTRSLRYCLVSMRKCEKKKVGILRTSGTCMFSGFLSVISDSFRSSSFRLCYNSCRRHCPRRKPLHAVTHKILAGETYVDEKKNAFSTKLAFWVDFLMRRETGKPEGNPRFRLALTETQPTNNRRDEHESPDRQPLRQCDSRDFQSQNRKKKKKTVYSVYFIYVYSIYAVDVIC